MPVKLTDHDKKLQNISLRAAYPELHRGIIALTHDINDMSPGHPDRDDKIRYLSNLETRLYEIGRCLIADGMTEDELDELRTGAVV